MRGADQPMRREEGFSLIEALVALTLLAFVLALSPAALRQANRALKGLGVHYASTSSNGSLRYVEQRLSEALPLYSERVGNSARVSFRGERGGLEFLAAMADTPLGGGIFRIALQIEGDKTSRLVMRVSPYRPGKATPPSQAVAREVSSGLLLAEFRYYGAAEPGASPAWHTTWRDQSSLPLLVEITLQERTARVPTRLRIALKTGRNLSISAAEAAAAAGTTLRG